MTNEQIAERDRIHVVYSLRSENTRISKLTEVQRVPESFAEYLLLTDKQKFELWKREKGAGE